MKENTNSNICHNAPLFPFGLLTPDDMIKIGTISKKYNVTKLKMTAGQKILFLDLEEKNKDKLYEELSNIPYSNSKHTIKYVKACLGTKYCKYGKQDVHELGTKILEIYHNISLPAKMKISLSACFHSCSESQLRDIGLIGTPKGYHLYLGGNGGMKPIVGILIAKDLNDKQILNIIDIIIKYINSLDYNKRVAFIIKEIGISKFLEDSKLKDYFNSENIELCI